MNITKNTPDLSDHDLLIMIYAKQEELIKQFTNHLRHHFIITVTTVSALITGLVTFLISLLV